MCVAKGFCGLSLSNSRARCLNSETIREPMLYLSSTGELGKIVMTQVHYRTRRNGVRLYYDVFPGYDAKAMGPNPYVMFRENFNCKHLASLIPFDHQMHIPQVAEPIDYSRGLPETDATDSQSIGTDTESAAMEMS